MYKTPHDLNEAQDDTLFGELCISIADARMTTCPTSNIRGSQQQLVYCIVAGQEKR